MLVVGGASASGAFAIEPTAQRAIEALAQAAGALAVFHFVILSGMRKQIRQAPVVSVETSIGPPRRVGLVCLVVAFAAAAWAVDELGDLTLLLGAGIAGAITDRFVAERERRTDTILARQERGRWKAPGWLWKPVEPAARVSR